MTGLVRRTVSPSSSSMSRNTPWVDGCCGPMLMIMVSSSDTSVSMSSGSTATPSGRRRTPSSNETPRGSRTPRRSVSSWSPSAVSSASCRSLWICVMTRSSPGPRRFLELHRHPTDGVVLAERMSFPVLRHEDASQVGVTVEGDAEHVVRLAFHGVATGPQVEQRGQTRIVGGHLRTRPQPPTAQDVDQRDHHFEPLTLDPVGHEPARVGQVVDGGEVGAHLIAVMAHLGEDLGVAVARNEDEGYAA